MSESGPVSRPWGAYQILDSGPGFQVKKLTVNPGEALSLQYHQRRHERWTVVGGSGRAIADDHAVDLVPGTPVEIPKGAVHRIENDGVSPLVVIEVQLGDYLEEDDIVRLEDRYGRAVLQEEPGLRAGASDE